MKEYNTPNFTAPTPEPTPTPLKTARYKGSRKFLVILLALIAVAGIGYSAYAWTQNNTLQSSVTSKDTQIKNLDAQVSTLKSTSTTTTTTTATNTAGNVISIRELGLSITVPDSIKDLTYSYSSGGGVESVRFSTKALTDKYASTKECTSFGSAAPLGSLDKFSGQYKAGDSVVGLLKQFTTYYISYSSPQATCADTQKTVPTELQVFKDSLTTIKEL